jgi:uncharacterized protein
MVRRQTCPVCGKLPPDDLEKARRFLPFCSDRCRSVDLLRWTQGRYAIVDQLAPEEAELLQHDPDVTIADDMAS